VILIKLHENHKNHRKGHVSIHNNKRMTGWRCDSNSEGVYFIEMVREPVRQDAKTGGTRDFCNRCKNKGPGKRNRYFRLGFRLKNPVAVGLKKGVK
jgi:hypothetical protein